MCIFQRICYVCQEYNKLDSLRLIITKFPYMFNSLISVLIVTLWIFLFYFIYFWYLLKLSAITVMKTIYVSIASTDVWHHLYWITIFHSVNTSIKHILITPKDCAIVWKSLLIRVTGCVRYEVFCSCCVGGPYASSTFSALIRVPWQICFIVSLYLYHISYHHQVKSFGVQVQVQMINRLQIFNRTNNWTFVVGYHAYACASDHNKMVAPCSVIYQL